MRGTLHALPVELRIDSHVDYLADLRPGGAIVGQEVRLMLRVASSCGRDAAGVARQDQVRCGSFYIFVEGRPLCHIREGVVRRVEQRPVSWVRFDSRQHRDLGDLCPCHVVIGAECAVGIPADQPSIPGRFYVVVEG